MKDRNTDYQAAVVPGGGLHPDGSLPPWVQARLEEALKMHDQVQYFLLLSGGTVHKPPPRDEAGFPIFESHAAAEYLLDRGIPPSRLLTETSSYDTLGNAYFSRVIHAKPQSLQRLMVITSQFHLQRTRAAFQWIYRLEPLPFSFQLDYRSVPDRGIPPDSLRVRRQRERSSLEHLKKLCQKFTTLKEFHSWLFSQHGAYTRQETREEISDDLSLTY